MLRRRGRRLRAGRRRSASSARASCATSAPSEARFSALHRRAQPLDARGACVRGEASREDRADAVVAASRRRPRTRRRRSAPSRTSRAIPTGSPSTTATSTWWSPSTRASCSRSRRREHVLRAAEPEQAGRGPSRSKTVWTTAVSPLRSGRTVIPLITSACMAPQAACAPWPAASSSRAIFCRWPVRAITLGLHGAGHPLPRLRRQAARLLDLRRRPADRLRPALGLHLEEEWADPDQRAFYAEVAQDARVVRFDRVGCGLSSRELDPRPTVESESRQLEAVIDAVGGRPSSSRRRAAASRRRSSPCARPSAVEQDRLLRRLRVAATTSPRRRSAR